MRACVRSARRPGDGYGSSIRVKTNIAEVLLRELARKSWRQENVTLGAATDPYQPAEARYALTRACILELARARTPVGIITRGPLIVRDIDVLQDASSRVAVSVNVSVPTLDEQVWRTTEPGTAPPHRRIEVVRRLAAAGIDTAVAMAPILPGLSDAPEHSKPSCAPRARQARARSGRAFSTSSRERASISSLRCPATGRRSWSATRSSTPATPIYPRAQASPSATAYAS